MQCVIVKNRNLLKNKKPEEYGIVLSKHRILLFEGGNLTGPSLYDIKEEIKVQTIYKTMLSYSLKRKINTGSKNLEVVKAKNGRIMLLSKCSD